MPDKETTITMTRKALWFAHLNRVVNDAYDQNRTIIAYPPPDAWAEILETFAKEIARRERFEVLNVAETTMPHKKFVQLEEAVHTRLGKPNAELDGELAVAQ